MAHSMGSLAFLVAALALLASAEAYGRRELLQSPAGMFSWPFPIRNPSDTTTQTCLACTLLCERLLSLALFLPSDI